MILIISIKRMADLLGLHLLTISIMQSRGPPATNASKENNSVNHEIVFFWAHCDVAGG